MFNPTMFLTDDGSGVEIQPQKIINITYALPRETLLGTPVSIGGQATEPVNPTFSYTIQNSDLPTFDIAPNAVKYAAYLYAYGKNLSGDWRTINYKYFKNGISVISGNAGSSNNCYWTYSAMCFNDVKVGDILSAKMWYQWGNIDIRYHSLVIVPDNIKLADDNTLITELSVSQINPAILTGGTTYKSMPILYQMGYNNNVSISGVGNDIAKTKAAFIDTNYGLYRLTYGDFSNVVEVSDNATPLRYAFQPSPSKIIYTPTDYIMP